MAFLEDSSDHGTGQCEPPTTLALADKPPVAPTNLHKLMGQRIHEFEVPAPPRKAVVLGIVTALGAGLLWGFISVITGYRLGWAAVLIGLAIGFVIRDSTLEQVQPTGLGCLWRSLRRHGRITIAGASRTQPQPSSIATNTRYERIKNAPERSHRTARLALGLTLGALALGRVVLQVGDANYVSTHEVEADPSLVHSAVMAQLERTMPGQLDLPPTQAQDNPSAKEASAQDAAGDEPAKPAPKLSRRQQLLLAYRKMHETAMERVAAMNQEDKRRAVQWYIDSSNVPVVRMHSPGGLLGRWDGVWWVLALIVAYLLTRALPQREDDAQEDDAEEIELDEELIR